jgi:cytochrome c-type biogenesis protein CcmH/NrfG
VKSCVWLLLFAGLLSACATPPRRETPAVPGGAAAGSNSIDSLAAAIEADAQRSDHESDSKIRSDLATQASADADTCLAMDSQAAPCLYGKGLSVGLEARAHPTRAAQLLTVMLQVLGKAEAADPNYDHAGPARVQALVLLRAPGWPLGPGDPATGLEAARRAVALQPAYPANLLALAEALSRTGDANGAHEAYTRARDFAQTAPAGSDRDDWLRLADEGLRRR